MGSSREYKGMGMGTGEGKGKKDSKKIIGNERG